MKEEDRLNALEVALTNERREREFYLKSAERCRNPLGKAMFKQIADDELEHYERLQEIHGRWKKEQKWPESLPVKVKGTLVRDILRDFLLKAESAAPGDNDDLKAVRTALDFEARGEKFYAQLRDASSDPKEKAFFDLLSKMERQHYLSLKDTEDYFSDPVGWFRKKEHHGIDGA
jgi:rubrerythrin